jgi:hypothetical protein
LGDDGNYHYDPERLSEQCIGGSNVISCPAQIQLPFFGLYSITLTAILIALIYVFLIRKKRLRKKK